MQKISETDAERVAEREVRHPTPQRLASQEACSTRRLARLRSCGAGPERVKLGRRVVYRLADIEAHEAARVAGPVAA